MHTGTLKKLALALTFWLALHMSSLKAQLLGPYGTSPTTFEIDANGLLWDTGTLGTGTLSLSGAGTRIFWYPGKAAFRAGSVDGTQWNDANIGRFSVAFGYETIASGEGSAAFGTANIASGQNSAAIGGRNTVSGFYSAAIGEGNTASAAFSTALGAGNTASNWESTAIGSNNTASGSASLALGGYGNTASGAYSTASGQYSTASAYNSFVVGFGNVGGGSPTSWVATDPLFEVGNGSKSGSGYLYGNPAASGPSDAFVVYKNGSATFQGPVTVAPGGDIPMYTGN